MVKNGMKDQGFEWIVLDDCWHPSRTGPNSSLVPFHDFFPNGMQPVIDYVHSLGLKFGLYTSVGTRTCHGGWSPGSFDHWDIDAQTFANWGVDYVKVDYCGLKDSPDGHKALSQALNKTGRPIVLELCRGPYENENNWGYASSVAQIWRATDDHHDSFDSTMSQVAAISKYGKDSYGSYGWAYGDMMMTGGQGCKNYDPHKPEHCPQQTDNEYRTEFSLYSVLNSPMMIGTDIRDMTKIMNETILNKYAIAINQDYKTSPGLPQKNNCGGVADQIWVKKLSDGSVAVAAPNLGDNSGIANICFFDVGISSSPVSVRNIWAGTTNNVTGSKLSAEVESHDTLFVIISV